MIGPPASMTGGIAGVAAQLHRIDYGPDVRTAFFATTHAPRTSESLPARALRHARHLAALRRTIAAVAPDIVHIHTCSGFSFYRAAADAQLARRARCRVILHVHGAAFDVFYARAGRTARWIIDKTLSAADSVIALSLGWQQKLHAIAPAARITVVANAVDLPPAPAKTPTDGPCRFLLLARMDTWKGVDDLLAACALLNAAQPDPQPPTPASPTAAANRSAKPNRRHPPRGIEVILAGPPGTAGDAQTLPQKIRALGLTSIVRYVGTVTGRRKHQLLQHADALVQPSHNEGMPLAVLEAMAHGLPIVATSVGAIPEVLTHGRHGYIVEPKRPDLLADALARLAREPDRRAAIARNARDLAVARFGTGRLRDDLARLYRHLRSARDRNQPHPSPTPRQHPRPASHRSITPNRAESVSDRSVTPNRPATASDRFFHPESDLPPAAPFRPGGVPVN